VECAKKPYPNWQHARNDARAMKRKMGERIVEPYICRTCGHIHVGTRLTSTEEHYTESPRFRMRRKARVKRVVVDDE
jgi:hypothetical protein